MNFSGASSALAISGYLWMTEFNTNQWFLTARYQNNEEDDGQTPNHCLQS